MAWNYRKRVKIAPGVHLNFSKNGVSTSIGPKGARISIGKNGAYLNTSIPGTGLYSRTRLSGKKQTATSSIMDSGEKKTSNNVTLFAIAIILLIVGVLILISQN